MFSFLRVGDPVMCTCFPPTATAFVGPPVPCLPGYVTGGSFNTFVEDKPVARQGDTTSNCCIGGCLCPNFILTGSFNTFVNDRPVARTIDSISCGYATIGSIQTFIG